MQKKSTSPPSGKGRPGGAGSPTPPRAPRVRRAAGRGTVQRQRVRRLRDAAWELQVAKPPRVRSAKRNDAALREVGRIALQSPQLRLDIQRNTRTPRRVVPKGRRARKPFTEYVTYFWAKGEMGDGYSYTGGRVTFAQQQRYARKQRTALSGAYDNAPGAFHSNEGLFLGQVKFPGRVPRTRLFDLLNRALNLFDKNGRLGDFRKAYRNWTWKWQVVQLDYPPGSKRKPKARVVERAKASSKGARG